MRKVTEYREHAEECLVMARRTKDETQKKQLIDMADAWTMLANERAAQLAKQAANGHPAPTPGTGETIKREH